MRLDMSPAPKVAIVDLCMSNRVVLTKPFLLGRKVLLRSTVYEHLRLAHTVAAGNAQRYITTYINPLILGQTIPLPTARGIAKSATSRQPM